MTDSKYICLLGMPIFDWQELIRPIKSICLDRCDFWLLNSASDCVVKAVPSFQESERERKRERERDEPKNSMWEFLVLFLQLLCTFEVITK